MERRIRLLEPPADLARRKLPLRTIKGSLYRIHRSLDNWRHFGKTKFERFDDPLAKYGVLYAAIQPEAAFAEVFLRNLSWMVISEQDLVDRSISAFAAASLRCVDLTGEGLRKLSCDNRISTEKPYHTVGLWSRALHNHPQRPDGIICRSRHNPRFKCLALFDRCDRRLVDEATDALMGKAWRAWTAGQLKKYNLALV